MHSGWRRQAGAQTPSRRRPFGASYAPDAEQMQQVAWTPAHPADLLAIKPAKCTEGTILLTHDETQVAIDSMKSLEPPVISLYMPGTPVAMGNSPHASETRVKNALGRLEVPSDVANRVLEAVRSNPHGRTTAIFANQQQVKAVELAADLPILDEATGRIDATWGAPLMAPLHLALSHPRFGIVHIDRERARIFESFLDEIEELETWERVEPEGDAYSMEKYSKSVRPVYTADRSDAVKDNLGHHLTEMVKLYYSEVATHLGELVTRRKLDCLIILGPEEDHHAFMDQMHADLRKLVACTGASLSSPRAETSEVFNRARPLMTETYAQQQRRITSEVLEHRKGITGRKACARALSERRVDTMVAAWQLPLMTRELLLQVAQEHATKLFFVESATGNVLMEKYEGLAAALRW